MVLPNSTYMVCRRCVGRQFLLKPDTKGLVEQVFLYCLAFAAQKTGVEVHSFCEMSNHYHANITDVEGRISEFMHDLNLYVGKCMNVLLGRYESLWAAEKFSAVLLEGKATIIKRSVYVMTNPVEAKLVRHGSQWPGAISSPRTHLEEPIVVTRPKVYFDENGAFPAKLELKVTMPPALAEEMSGEELAELLTKEVAERERELLEKMTSEGHQPMGVAKVLAQDPFDCPAAHDPRKGINPRVASESKWHRFEMLQRQKSFLDAYREAWEAYKAGDKDVQFPAGTYLMAKQYKAKVAPLE
jgi:putative transposase